VPADSVSLVLARFDAAGALVWARLDGGAGGEIVAVDVVTRTNGAFTVPAWVLNGSDVVLGAGGPNEIAVPPGDLVALPTYSADGELLETPLERLGSRGAFLPFPHPTPHLAPVLPARPGAR
jgi:hypothetical protein